jgi:hypothetical protein
MELRANAVLVDDQEGGEHVGILLARMPVNDGAIDTSSPSLSHAPVFYDDCQGTVYAHALWTNQTYVIKTGILDTLHAMTILLDQLSN